MKKLVALLWCGLAIPLASSAIDLKEAKFTQIVNDVEVITPSQSIEPAAVNGLFKMPDVLRTGPDSRAELVAADHTVTRVGADTIFSFDPSSRTIDLKQGSLLFHSEKGMGGGTIRTGAATASVLGTTIIVTTTPNGGFKLLDLEGNAEIHFLNGLQQRLSPGQMTFILPSGQRAPIIVFRLDQQTKGSKLVNGFSQPLSSLPKIEKQVANQLKLIKSGRDEDTGLLVGDEATASQVQVVDPSSIQAYQNTIVPSPPPTPPKAFGNDANIASSTLDPNQVASQSFVLPTVNDTPINGFIQGLSFLGVSSPSAGFLGNNITINTPVIDLSPYAGNPDFEFMAAGNLNVQQSVKFTGISPAPAGSSGLPATVALIAGGQLSIASGSTLEADTEVFGLAANSFSTLQNVSLLNSIGDIDILSLSDLSFIDSTVNAGGSVDIESQGGTLNLNTAGGSGNVISAGNSIYLFGESGLNVNGGSVSAGIYLNLDSGGDLSISGSSIASGEDGADITASGSINVDNSSVTVTGSYLDFYAGNNLTINNSSIQADEILSPYGGFTAGGNIEINNSQLRANYGDVDLSSGFGTFTVDNGSVISSPSAVNLASSGDMSIYGSKIDAQADSDASSGYINISSGGMLTLDLDDSGDADNFNADDAITLYGASGVSINNASIFANGEVGGGMSISSGYGPITMNSDNVSAPNGVNVSTLGDISIYNSGIDARVASDFPGFGSVGISSGGMLNVSSDGNGNYYIDADNGVTLSGASGVNIGDVSIYAGGSEGAGINISSSAGDVVINSTPITANNGDVNIDSYVGALMVDETGSDGNYTIAGNNINLSGVSGVTINNAILNANSGGVNIYDSPGFSSSTPATINLALNDTAINAPNGSVDIYDVPSSASGPNQVNNKLDINVNGTTISAGDQQNEVNGSVVISTSSGLLSLGDDASGVGSSVSANGSVSLSGQTGVNVNDTTVTASSGSVNITANSGQISMGGAAIEADGNNSINMTTPGPISMVGGSLTAASGAVNMTSGNSVTMNGTELTASSATVNAAGAITANLNAQSQVTYLTLNSGDGILLDGGNPRPTGLASGVGTMNLTAPNSPGSAITVQNMDLSSYKVVQWIAYTLNTFNVAFGINEAVNGGTATGLVNFGGSIEPGHWNINNVTVGGTPIADASQIDFSTGPSTAPGLHSFKN